MKPVGEICNWIGGSESTGNNYYLILKLFRLCYY